ncbi:hypothetical protein [Haladaptatus cibarius]|uniref:hypothetical protein n=1 Tax=Haladaptatus cibarius TaxID=453847 RepID=UPI000AED4378|nr:hypothetical protein [Haladaptatus cibarius]
MLRFEPLTDADLAVIDSIERRRYVLGVSSVVNPEPADETLFHFPVDRAVRISTDELRLDQRVDTFVRGARGEPLFEVSSDTNEQLPAGTYTVELNAPVKLYLRVDGELSVRATMDSVVFGFDPAEVRIGARSYHKHPAVTVTTTDDPEDVFSALSSLSSALKTTTCERSYPTLRGHPPSVELGDELHVPDELERPDTGVRLELPPTLRSAYVSAPLAYYLGAEMVPGDDPKLVADGFEYLLSEANFETEIERVLKQVFFLDCLTRTEGYYRVDLYEREQAERTADLTLDFTDLYDRPIAEQLPEYLSVSFDRLAPWIPRWPLTAHVAPTPERIEALPFVVNDLGIVKTPRATPASVDNMLSSALDSFLRTTRSESTTRDEGTTRGWRKNDSRFVCVHADESLEQAWFADDIPLRATKAMPQAFRNKLDRKPNADTIDIAVVCNDSAMAADEGVETAYGRRPEVAFDVTFHDDCSTDELRSVLEFDVDFLHYVGHIDDEGFRCRDGALDATTLTTVGVATFLLNACQSYEQGVALIDAGAVGGVVTFHEVVNDGAAKIGYAMARLLNLGFPLRSALALARAESIVGSHYLVVGDGSADVVQVEDGVPTLCDIVTRDDGEYDVTPRTYPSREGKVGTMAFPLVESNDQHFLVPGATRTFRLTADELRQYLVWHQSPVRKDGDLVWDERSL